MVITLATGTRDCSGAFPSLTHFCCCAAFSLSMAPSPVGGGTGAQGVEQLYTHRESQIEGEWNRQATRTAQTQALPKQTEEVP